MADDVQCVDLSADRKVGEYWERQFCRMAAMQGRMFTPHQIGRAKSAQAYGFVDGANKHWTLPDVTVWTKPGEHHEIKHKDPSTLLGGAFGLERYRLDALLTFANETGQRVLYTIHNYAEQPDATRAERKANEKNESHHWVTSDVNYLSRHIDLQRSGQSWVNGSAKVVSICYWRVNRFWPLSAVWAKIDNESRAEVTS